MSSTGLRRRFRQQGFTLLEAIVALTLIALGGAALFSWINTNLISLARVKEANARSLATNNVIELMQTVNPMLEPKGQRDMGGYSIEWNAVAVRAPQDGSAYPRGMSLFRLGLFDNHIRVMQNSTEWFALDLRQVGYHRVRELRLPGGAVIKR